MFAELAVSSSCVLIFSNLDAEINPQEVTNAEHENMRMCVQICFVRQETQRGR